MSTIIRFMPVALVIAALGLTLSDQYTDGASTHRICTADCTCVYHHGYCDSPIGICSSANFSGITAMDYCNTNGIVKGSCLAKASWPVPETCQYYWGKVLLHEDGQRFGCQSSCDLNDYSFSIDKTFCLSIEPYKNPEIRHPYWCVISTGFIIAPSILNNLFLLYSLLHKSNYKIYFVSAGLSCIADIQYANIAIIFLSILQVLPYLLIILKVVIMLRICMKYINEDHESNGVMLVTTKINALFSFTEDLPQLTLQMMFFVRAVMGDSEGIVDAISWVLLAGLLTSCISLSKNYTEYITGPHGSVGSKICTFFTALLATGGRVLTCCILGIELSWLILLPILSLIAINIMKCFWKFVFGNLKISIGSSLCQNLNIIAPQETKHQKLFHIACKSARGLRSLVFGVIIDGQSTTGLWSSAFFASIALYVHFQLRNIYEGQLVMIIMAITLVSYIINAITVLLNGQHRGEGLLVAVLFIIYPIIVLIGNWQYPGLDQIIIPVTLGCLVIIMYIMSIVLALVRGLLEAVNTVTEGLV